jgi:hypothetical protein
MEDMKFQLPYSETRFSFLVLKEDSPIFSAIVLPRHDFKTAAAKILLRRMKHEDRFVNYSDVDTSRVIILVNKIRLFSK